MNIFTCEIVIIFSRYCYTFAFLIVTKLIFEVSNFCDGCRAIQSAANRKVAF